MNSTEVLAGSGSFVLSFAFLFYRKTWWKPGSQSIVPLGRFELFAWLWVYYHEVVIKYCIRGLLPVWGEERDDSWASVIVRGLFLEWHLYVWKSNLFLCFCIKLIIQLIYLVQVLYLYFLVRFFLREHSVDNRSLRTTLNFYVALRVDIVAFNVKTRVNYNWSFLLPIFILGNQLMTFLFVSRSRLVVLIHVCISNKFSCFFVSSK